MKQAIVFRFSRPPTSGVESGNGHRLLPDEQRPAEDVLSLNTWPNGSARRTPPARAKLPPPASPAPSRQERIPSPLPLSRSSPLTDVEIEQISARASGSRSESVVDALAAHAREEIESWLDATQAVCVGADAQHNAVLTALASSRSLSIRKDLRQIFHLITALRRLETARLQLRNRYRDLRTARDAAHLKRLRDLIRAVDDTAGRLLEVERRRAELIGEIGRLSLSAANAVKTLYAQVAALAGLPTPPEMDPTSDPA